MFFSLFLVVLWFVSAWSCFLAAWRWHDVILIVCSVGAAFGFRCSIMIYLFYSVFRMRFNHK